MSADRFGIAIEPLLHRGLSAYELSQIHGQIELKTKGQPPRRRNELLAEFSEIYGDFFTRQGAQRWESLCAIRVGREVRYPDGFLGASALRTIRARCAKAGVREQYTIQNKAKGSKIVRRKDGQSLLRLRAHLNAPDGLALVPVPNQTIAWALEENSSLATQLQKELSKIEANAGDNDGVLAPRDLEGAPPHLRSIMDALYRRHGRKKLALTRIGDALPRAVHDTVRAWRLAHQKELLPFYKKLVRLTLDQLQKSYHENVIQHGMSPPEFLSFVGVRGPNKQTELRKKAPEVFVKPTRKECEHLYGLVRKGELALQAFYRIAQIDSETLSRWREETPAAFPPHKSLNTRWSVRKRARKSSPSQRGGGTGRQEQARAVATIAWRCFTRDVLVTKDDIIEAVNSDADYSSRYSELDSWWYYYLRKLSDEKFPPLRTNPWQEVLKEEIESIRETHPNWGRTELFAKLKKLHPNFNNGRWEKLAASYPGLMPKRESVMGRAEEILPYLENVLEQAPHATYDGIAAELKKHFPRITKVLVGKIMRKHRTRIETVLSARHKLHGERHPCYVRHLFPLVTRLSPPGTNLTQLNLRLNRLLSSMGLEEFEALDRNRFKERHTLFAKRAAEALVEYASNAPRGASHQSIVEAMCADYPTMDVGDLKRYEEMWRAAPQEYPELKPFWSGGKKREIKFVGKGTPPKSPRYLGGWDPERFMRTAAGDERVELAKLAQWSQIPTSLPLLSRVFPKDSSRLSDANVLSVSHLLATTVPYVHELKRQGLSLQRTTMVGTPYGSCDTVRRALEEESLDVRVPNLSMESYRRTVEKALDDVVRRHRENKRKIIVLDDGGLVTDILHSKAKYADVLHAVRVVEQTTGGLYLTDAHHLRVPVINVARSLSKQREGRFIGAALARKVVQGMERLHQDVRGKRAVVMGYGVIGREVARELKRLGAKVVVVEATEQRRAKARRGGFSTRSKRLALKQAQLVVGCTGHTSLGVDDMRLLSSGAVMVSASSKRREFAMAELEKAANSFNPVPCDVPLITLPSMEYTLGRKKLVVLGDGWPINFDGDVEDIPSGEIQLTRALMLGGALQAAATQGRCGLVAFDPALDKRLVAEHTALAKNSPDEQAPDPARFVEVLCDVAKDLGELEDAKESSLIERLRLVKAFLAARAKGLSWIDAADSIGSATSTIEHWLNSLKALRLIEA